jgi:hypothetical protein
MRCAFVILLVCLAGASSALAAGCQQQQTFSDQEKADIHDSWNPRSSQSVAHPQSAVLAEGPAPLLYQARESGTIRVTDAGSGASLASAVVNRGTLIRLDPETGIFVDERRIRPGPLPEGRRFNIVIDMNSFNDWQSRVEAPKPAPPPATRPANESRSSPDR